MIYASGEMYPNQPLAQNSSLLTADSEGNESIETHYENGNLSVALDSTTEYDKDDISIYGDTVLEKAEAGYNFLELALVEANATTISASKAPQIEDYVWSWNSSSPSSDTDTCALLNSSDELVDQSCSTSATFACVDENRDWHFTTTSSQWSDGFNACEAQGYQFAMPYNARENAALITARSNAEITSSTWVNYYQAVDGFWLANQASYLDTGYNKNSAVGGSDGSSFDGIDLLKRKLLGSGTMNLSSVKINASSSRVRGIKACYSFSQPISQLTVNQDELCVEYGGDDSDWSDELSMDPSNGDYLTEIKICTDDETYSNGSVYYLQMKSNTGTSIEAGSSQGDCKTYSSTSDQQIFAFHGYASSSELYGLGTYNLSNQLVDPGYYATDWLNITNGSSETEDESFVAQQSTGNIATSCSVDDIKGFVARTSDNKLNYTLTQDSLTLGILEDDEGNPQDYQFRCENDTCQDYEVKYFFSNATCTSN
ncbi:jacalin-like lectin [uncultured Shewanella sp.]|uniref:jacalin-like lectin n=1 Tax=uncultured Shewanella sp. TaxID=173975 RepID=UPI0026299C14|nr:jacalin-like lectin [uncultured Shewanella sp.]